MEIDDSNDKIRRNLVAFCGVICGFYYLHIDLMESVILVLPEQFKVPNHKNAWHISLILFVYLLYRFGTSKEAIKQFNDLRTNFSNYCNKKLEEDIKIYSAMKLTTRRGSYDERSVIKINENYSTGEILFNKENNEKFENINLTRQEILISNFFIRSIFQKNYTITVDVKFRLKEYKILREIAQEKNVTALDGTDSISTIPIKITFSPRRLIFIFRLMVATLKTIFCQDGAELLFPLILIFFTASIFAEKILKHLLIIL